MRRCCGKIGILGVLAAAALAQPGAAQDLHGFNTYGFPGVIDMPSGLSRPDGELSFSVSHFRNQTRQTLSFQIAPRLTGSFRYAQLHDVRRGGASGTVEDFIYDRSFSLHYQLFEEGVHRPAVAIGLNDFLGTGIYASEYVAATKTFGDRLRLTGGIGWGRLGGVGGFENPLAVFSDGLEERERLDPSFGGRVSNVTFFSGDAALFGGLEYRLNDRTWLMAEYSSDAYPPEDGAAFDRRSPVNLGLSYQLNDYVNLSGHYLYGSEFGAMLTFGLDPAEPPGGSGREAAPPPVVPARAAAASWQSPEPELRAATERALQGQGIALHSFRLEGDTARVEIGNDTYPRTAQAIGRTARVLSATLPGEVDRFTITPVARNLRGTAATVTRATLETYEFALDQAWEGYSRTGFDGAPTPLAPVDGRYPALDYGIGPYFAESLFDPDAPLRLDLGVELTATYEPAPGLVLHGRLRQKLVGNRDESTRASTSVLPRVRSEANIYAREGATSLAELTGAYYFSPAPRVAARVTAGYLEPMFAGLSTELLWAPENSPLSYGIEVNHVRQRAFDQGFDLRDYEVTTGHASLYWDIGNGYSAQIDAGRYLAGDWGATLALDRSFENGWEIGAFATLTDVPFDEFGEGSFDKGLRITIPIGWINGDATTERFSRTIRPVLRDGGARLAVSGRLHGITSGRDAEDYMDGWGRFWR